MKEIIFSILLLFISHNLFSQDYEDVIEKARICYQNREFDCSEKLLLEAIRLTPKDYINICLLYNNLANSQFFQGKKKGSLNLN